MSSADSSIAPVATKAEATVLSVDRVLGLDPAQLQAAHSLRKKILLPMLVVGLFFLSLMALLSWQIYASAYYEAVKHRSQTISSVLHYSLEEMVDFRIIQRQVMTLGSERDIKEIVVVIGQPAIIMASTRAQWLYQGLSVIADAAQSAAIETTQSSRRNFERLDQAQNQFLWAGHFVRNSSANSLGFDDGVIYLIVDTSAARATAWAATYPVLLVMMLAWLVVLALVYFLLNRHVVAPTKVITHALTRQAQGQENAYSALTTTDEIGVMGRVLDALLQARHMHEITQHNTLEVLQKTLRELQVSNQQMQIAGERLQASESELAKLALVAQSTSDAIVIMAQDGAIEWVNDAFAKVSGVGRAEVLQRSLVTLLSGWLRSDEVAGSVFYCLQRGESLKAEVEFNTASGDTGFADLKLHPVRKADSNVAHYILVATDVSERVLAHQKLALALSEVERQRFAVDQHAIVGITDGNGRLSYANDRFCQIAQYRREELLGHRYRMLNSGVHAPAFWQQFWATISAGSVWHGEICNRRKNGEFYWLDATVVPFLDALGQPYQYVSINTDISARKAGEADLIQARDSAEAATRSKSDFLANMSHEIRTPMNAVLGLTEVLRSTVLDGEQRDYVETIHNAGESLLVIINDVLDFSKMEAGKMTLAESVFDLEAEAHDVLRMLALKAQSKTVELILDYDVGCPRRFLGDALRLRQVLLNLCSNAVKFTEQGYVRIAVRNDEHSAVETRAGLCRLRIEIQDTGIGIDAEAQTKLFQSFNQADASISRQFGGTGLGLAISKKIIDLMGGQIGVNSNPGSGSTFWLSLGLPYVGDDHQLAHSLSLLTGTLAGRTVWLIESQVMTRLILQKLLYTLDLTVRVVDPAHDPLPALAELGPSLVLIERELADGSGWLTRWQSAPPPDAAMILLLACGSRVDADSLRALPSTSVLVKPVESVQLRQAVRRAFGLLAPVTGPQADAALMPVSLPAAVDATGVIDESGGRTRHARILVAEDVVANQMVIRAMLSKLGMQVVFANNGEQALALWAQGGHDLIFMDCQMPVVDGITATRRLRAAETGTRIPIIALTANALQDDRKRCLEAGMDDFLSKPVKRQALVEVLRRWLPAHG